MHSLPETLYQLACSIVRSIRIRCYGAFSVTKTPENDIFVVKISDNRHKMNSVLGSFTIIKSSQFWILTSSIARGGVRTVRNIFSCKLFFDKFSRASFIK